MSFLPVVQDVASASLFKYSSPNSELLVDSVALSAVLSDCVAMFYEAK